MKQWLIYHITAIDNLPSILKSNGLHCKSQQPEGCRNIAYGHIQERRSSTIVPIEPKGIIHDYVPFYFAPRSPMLYVNFKHRIEEFSDGQHRIIYLVSSINKIEKMRLSYVFTDGHAAMDISEFYNKKTDLDKVDWAVMKSKYWNDTAEEPDRKRRRQAEFLLHEFLPLETILGIGVYNESVKEEVELILNAHKTQVKVKVVRDWYY